MAKKWHSTLGGNFIDVTEPLNADDVHELLSLKDLDRIQVSPPLLKFNETFHLLNDHLFTVRPDIGLRVYGKRESFDDLTFLKSLNNVRRFSIDEWNLIDLSPISYLQNITELSIGETKSTKLSYEVLGELKNLQKLYINGTKKNINAISKLQNLESLYLNSVSLDSLEILLPLKNLKELHINFGGIRNYDYLPKIGRVNTLELCWIKELPQKNLMSIAHMPFLEELILSRLPNITSIEWLKETQNLKKLTLEELKVWNHFRVLMKWKN